MAGTATVMAAEHPRALVILGHPVAQSLSPLFQSAALEATGIAVRYTRRDTPPELLDQTLEACARGGIGGNVTMPLKEAMLGRASRVSAMAERVGAVNTFWFEQGELVGHNTDVEGVHSTLDVLLPRGAAGSVVLLGAGGAAAAALVALTARGVADITVLARTPARATRLVERTGVRATVLPHDHADSVDALKRAELIINGTSIGMRDEALPVSLDALGSDTAVFDLVYRQGSTAFVRAAKARGLRAEDGLRMLVEQGAAAFRCWFGIEAPRAVMWQALGASMPASDTPRG